MIHTVKIGELEYLSADNISSPHGFTTRYGGVSRGHLASFNIGIHRGDAPENVFANFKILGDVLGFVPEQLVLTKQTHTDIVRKVGTEHLGAGLFKQELDPCDGLITDTPGVGLVVFSADCTPILLEDPETGAVGAVHAGWRGTAAAIAGKAVDAMVESFGCCRKNIRAAIGPNIGMCCFQTDEDVPLAMKKQFGSEAELFIRADRNKYYVNLKEMNVLALRRAGVERIAISDVCTACEPNRFWSHRVVGDNRGSQGAVIICKGVMQ